MNTFARAFSAALGFIAALFLLFLLLVFADVASSAEKQCLHRAPQASTIQLGTQPPQWRGE